MPTVKVGDINMYYEINGAGPPLLLIMGLGSDLSAWMFQIPEFSKKYQVVAFDNRGVGRTDAPDKPYSVKMMADDTVGLMNALRIDVAQIVGVSMGGFIAQELALKYPGRVKSMALVCTAAKSLPKCNSIISGWSAAVSDEVSAKTFVQLGLPYLFTDRFFEDQQMVQKAMEILSSNPYPPTVHGYARQVTACIQHDTRARLKAITVPTLVLVGKEDNLLPVKLSEELASLIPNAKLVVLDGGGHGFTAEIPDKFNQAVLEFLTQTA